MKILMVSDAYFPEPGGIAEHIYNLSRELRRHGHTVKVLTTSYKSAPRGDWRSDDEEHIFRIGRGLLIPANKSLSRITVGYRVGKEVKDLLCDEQFDIVHIHGSLAPTLPLQALKNSHSLNIGTFHAGHKTSIGYEVFQSYLAKYFRRLHGLIAVSDAARRAMAEYFEGDYRIIPNAIDTDVFNPLVKPMPEFDDTRPKVMFMGRFDPRKGLKYLLRTLPIVQKVISNVLYIIVGSGPFGVEKYRGELDPELRNSVVFTGPILGPKRARYYASTTVFCSPATGNESFGIILLEAMAAGKPVVASYIEGYREVLADGKEGLFAPPRDEEALADRIIQLLRDPERVRRMGDAGRAKALSYSWPEITRRVEAYYAEIAARHLHLPAY